MHRQASYGPFESPVSQFIVATNLIFVLCEDGHFYTYSTQTGKEVRSMTLENKELSGLMHPVTYLNKLLFYGDKSMELWNVVEKEMIYTFTFGSEVECVVQSPVIDIVAVGCRDG